MWGNPIGNVGSAELGVPLYSFTNSNMKKFSSEAINKKRNVKDYEPIKEVPEGLDKNDAELLRDFLSNPVLIEKTRKHYKAIMLAGMVFMVIGCILLVLSLEGDMSFGMLLLSPIIVVTHLLTGVSGKPWLELARAGIGFGVVAFIVGKLLAWWDHG